MLVAVLMWKLIVEFGYRDSLGIGTKDLLRLTLTGNKPATVLHIQDPCSARQPENQIRNEKHRHGKRRNKKKENKINRRNAEAQKQFAREEATNQGERDYVDKKERRRGLVGGLGIRAQNADAARGRR